MVETMTGHMNGRLFITTIGILTLALGCEIGPSSGRGLRLPDGDVAMGKVAFSELGCGGCHSVVGEPGKSPGEGAAPNVRLGGEVSRIHSYGELVTFIVNPSHRITGRYPRDTVAEGDVSKMELGNLNEKMTVAQLIDVVAYLQSKYERRREPMYVP